MNAPDFRPFEPTASCPKCGHSEVGTRYHERTCYTFSHSAPCKWTDTHAGGGKGRCCTMEHLDRNCMRCHYSWPEMVLG